MALVEIEEKEIEFDNDSEIEPQFRPLVQAVIDNHADDVEQLLVEMGPGVDLNGINKNGDTLLHIAAELGNLSILESLICRGLDVHQLNDNCENAIHTAVYKKHFHVVRFLSEKGVSLDIQNKNGEAPMHLAAKSNNMQLMEFFCTAGANLNVQDKLGDTALHKACWHGLHKIVMVLCAAHVYPDVQNKEGETPLISATARGSVDCVKILLNSSAKVILEDKNGWTALEHAIKRHETTIALMLINAGAKVNHVDMNRDTTLHLACREGLLPVVQALCAFGCRVDVYNAAGLIPLHIASRIGYLEVVRCLLLAGSNPQLPNKEGIYGEIMAYAQGHKTTAALLAKMKPEKRAICVEQLVPTTRPLPRIKLKVFGPPLCGKTSLIESLKSNYISGFFRKKFKSVDSTSLEGLSMRQRSVPSEMNFEVQHENYTRGVNIQNLSLAGSGEMSVWEYSGYEPYYLVYDHFIGDTSCIHLVLFNLHEPYDLIKARVLFWLNFIKARIPSREPLGFCGKPRSMAKVMLVGTHADHSNGVKNLKGITENKDAYSILQEAKRVFRYTLEIFDEVFALNCNDPISPDMKNFKVKLGDLRSDIIRRLPHSNGFLEVVASKVGEWKNESNMPIFSWQQFVEQVRSTVNPLCSEDHLKDLIQELQYVGEVIYVEWDSGPDLLILQPRWLTADVIGALLSQENRMQARVTGSFTEEELHLMLGSPESTELVGILSALDLCSVCVVEGETQLEVPALNLLELYQGLWDRETRHQHCLYAGTQFVASKSQLVHLFPRIQNQLRRSLVSEELEDDNQNCDYATGEVELDQWFHGSKLTCRGKVECLISMEDGDQVIEVKARAPREMVNLLFGYYQDSINLVEQVIEEMCPSLEYEMFVIYPDDLKKHNRHFRKMHQREIFSRMLEMSSTSLPPDALNAETIQVKQTTRATHSEQDDPLMKLVKEEEEVEDYSLTDLLFFSEHEIQRRVTLGPKLHISCLRTPIFQRLCLLLDPADPMGRDWCLLAVKLGLSQEVPQIDNSNEWLRSRTATILDLWGREVSNTTEKLIGVFQEMNRSDAANLLIASTPIYHFEAGTLRMDNSTNQMNARFASPIKSVDMMRSRTASPNRNDRGIVTSSEGGCYSSEDVVANISSDPLGGASNSESSRNYLEVEPAVANGNRQQ